MANSREVASVVPLLLLILYQQSSAAVLIQLFLHQRISRLRFLNAIIHCFLPAYAAVHAIPEEFKYFHGLNCGFSNCWMMKRWITGGKKTSEFLGQHLSISASLLDQHLVDKIHTWGMLSLSKRESGQVYGQLLWTDDQTFKISSC